MVLVIPTFCGISEQNHVIIGWVIERQHLLVDNETPFSKYNQHTTFVMELYDYHWYTRSSTEFAFM